MTFHLIYQTTRIKSYDFAGKHVISICLITRKSRSDFFFLKSEENRTRDAKKSRVKKSGELGPSWTGKENGRTLGRSRISLVVDGHG